MFAFEKIPKYIFDVLDEKGIDVENLYIATRCDMDENHSFGDTYIFATDKKLYILSGYEKLESKEGKKKFPWRRFVEKSFVEYDSENIEHIRLEELISSSRLVAKTKDGEYIFLSAMTNFCKASAGLFCKYFGKIKKGDITSPNFEIDNEDDPAQNCCPKCGMRYPDRNRKVCPRCMEKGKLFARFSTFLLKYKLDLAVIFASLILMTGVNVAVTYITGTFFYDEVLTRGGSIFGQVALAIAIIVGAKLLSTLAHLVNACSTTIIAAKIVYDLKKTIFGAIEKLSMSFFSARQTGGLMTQVNDDSNTIYSFFCDGVPYLMSNILQVILYLFLMLFMNVRLTVLTLIPAPIFFYLLRYVKRGSQKRHAKNYSNNRRLNSQLSDVLGGIRVVKAFSKEGDEGKRFHKGNKRAADGDKSLSLFSNYAFPAVESVLYVGNSIALGVGGYMVLAGVDGFSYGQLITFIAALNSIYAPLAFFSNMMDSFASTSNALQRLYEIYDTEPEITEKENAITPEKIEGKVEFKNVDFGYSKHKKIIDNVSFTAEAGQTIGIVGHTGAGKSTIVNMIMRLYDCDEGEVLIDGINVKDMSFKALYENVAIVSQETYLFIGSVLENIRYARPDATYDEVIRAAKCAGAHDFIMRLPDGYNTKIGMGYKDLSGGERQRVSIARAILRDPKILILDEATAAMDTKTEKMIQNALTSLTQGKTTIMIAHRLSTLRDATKLIVIERGKVVEEGTHKELLDKEGGVYNKLYTLQLEALKNAGIAE